ncbi:MAG: hypothetical protein QM650_16865 [Microlunatus sp.]
MSRRVKLPGASELFRSTGGDGSELPSAGSSASARSVGPEPSSAPTVGTGRVRHDEKITVYVSREELLALEQARLRLRGELGVAVDRGRLVRAAMALALADLDAAGESSELVRRLTAS